MDKIDINIQFERTLSFVNQTSQLIFLTGKAGTGKTTLLKYIKENTFKQLSIIAPTGVAAINACGSTIHSFFQFPFTPFVPILKDTGDLDIAKNTPVNLKYNSHRLAIFRHLELLIIDEISMVRADMLDQIDFTLRLTRKKWNLPFGGVQVILIGDMYQLPPVIQKEEWQLLKEIYASPYFFDSLVVKNNPPVYLELEKIYRQKDNNFIELLNKVRNNKLDLKSLDVLNSYYKPNISSQDYQNNISLTTHNKKADEINNNNLRSLSGKEYKFKSKIDGFFSHKNYPTDEILILKKGTRVMFVKNNSEKNYYNGKIGIVSFIDNDIIRIKCDEDVNQIDVGKETWSNVSYKLDKSTKHIEEEILGTFTQYPLRLAWAITIHKSQGLTFDKLIVDAADSFTPGQVYVALSRCRSLSGLILSSKISLESLLNDNHILNFSLTKQNNDYVNTIFNKSQHIYVKSILLNLFDFSELMQIRKDLFGVIQFHLKKINSNENEWCKLFFDEIDLISNVSEKFTNQLLIILENSINFESNLNLQDRIIKAANYFEIEIKKCLDLLKECPLISESKEAANEINQNLQTLFDGLFLKYTLIKSCNTGFIFSNFIKNKLKVVFPEFKINIYASANNIKVSAEILHPKLYRELILLRDKICNEEQKPIYLIANNKTLTELANFLPVNTDQLFNISGFSTLKIDAYGSLFLELIKAYMIQNNLETNIDFLLLKKGKKSKKSNKNLNLIEKKVKVNTKEQTFRLYKYGFKVNEIAEQRGFSVSTIEGHLIPYLVNGDIHINDLVSIENQNIISKVLNKFDYKDGINSIKKKLPSTISFTEIRYVLANKIKGID